MSSEPVISVRKLGKCYQLYARPHDRLKQFLSGGKRRYYREFWALRDVSFEVWPGEVVGIIGANGSGKSTLLQLVCGTLTPTCGEVSVKGRVAALLELGAGFNPEFSGRENVFMSAAILGLSPREIAARYEEIVEFSGIRDFIDQPVKTYSSGMYVRLAFSIATSVDPDILVIDEALSVGDGAFARKSFDRIMALKDRGVTILFCSHSMYQIESICNRAIWLDRGQLKSYGEPERVVMAYQSTLADPGSGSKYSPDMSPPSSIRGHARFARIKLSCDGLEGRQLTARSGISELTVEAVFSSDPTLPAPALAVTFDNAEWRMVASTISLEAGVIERDDQGNGSVCVRFPALPLLKGSYSLSFYLTCEKGLHFYDAVPHQYRVDVEQESLEQGIFQIPRRWQLVRSKA